MSQNKLNKLSDRILRTTWNKKKFWSDRQFRAGDEIIRTDGESIYTIDEIRTHISGEKFNRLRIIKIRGDKKLRDVILAYLRLVSNNIPLN